ncbi:hypothetical protein [Desulfogranum marinum]|uniref:hypothetical protein n=1 Tax=Desulfogranum marinum TaxID=453220 RepID=UPI0029C8CB0D|nr:hypothetical protein [Desulfogranum marinum]
MSKWLTEPTAMPTMENIEAISARGHSLFIGIGAGFGRLLIERVIRQPVFWGYRRGSVG